MTYLLVFLVAEIFYDRIRGISSVEHMSCRYDDSIKGNRVPPYRNNRIAQNGGRASISAGTT